MATFSCWKLPSECTKSCKRFNFLWHQSLWGSFKHKWLSRRKPGETKFRILYRLRSMEWQKWAEWAAGWRCSTQDGWEDRPLPNSSLLSLADVCQHYLGYSRDGFFNFAYTIHSVSMPCVTSYPQLCLSFATVATRLPP